MAATQMSTKKTMFYGWRVVGAAFVLAVFGWGLGFYGPPVYLHAVREARGWSLPLVSAAVTTHYLVGALVVANLPMLYRRFGLPNVTKLGALSAAVGICGWALAMSPWQLFVATIFSGAGWVTMGAAAINAIVSPWFVRTRPAALATAYNGASIGGVVLAPIWVTAIGFFGFPVAAGLVGFVTVVAVWVLAATIFARTPAAMGLRPDGDAEGVVSASITSPQARPLPGSSLYRDLRFLTLAAGMALGLFAQVGLLTHLFSLLVPALGAQAAGFAMGGATAAAIAGRTLFGWLMPVGADRRFVICASYAMQSVGVIAFLAAGSSNIPLLLAGVILFGAGIGNATSLPPLIAQVEFVKDDVPRVVALIVATAQATYAFAPAVFGLIREIGPYANPAAGIAPSFYAAVVLVQTIAIAVFLIGRIRPRD